MRGEKSIVAARKRANDAGTIRADAGRINDFSTPPGGRPVVVIVRRGEEAHPPGKQVCARMPGKSGRLIDDIASKRPGIFVMRITSTVKIAAQGLDKLRLSGLAAFVESRFIGRDAAIDRACHSFDLFAYGQIANPHLAQILVHILEHHIEQLLGKHRTLLALVAQATEQQEDVKRDHVETAVKRIRRTKPGVESRLASLAHGSDIKGIGGAAQAGAAEEAVKDHSIDALFFAMMAFQMALATPSSGGSKLGA